MLTKSYIARTIKMSRVRKGYTQQQIADRLGKSQQVVAHWETGYSQPDLGTLCELLNLLNVSFDEVFLNIRRE